ncbi:hypothetical protein GUITHDRAFT_116257 [Guillardia theta CCMP2712]|uniref:Uncharacterized protein n=1 Tax=Guillardia theta (strain CCMP2712) TaxID=905079 RepID=L1IP76_GUITC|nr:hypothetical protein GUITHDRAFT_116257 [Guillardia theta CCMP2712]EKX37620.1 hypothetical protein GUITHDRAFT_116257 [Guillardia theta CCMP2712]|eukprot:XP_005824600.1 hypothetical protein GUITHDRAFT_116257 [Guillardia theta CCMP2712]
MGNENSVPKKQGEPDILEAIGLGWIAPKEEPHSRSNGENLHIFSSSSQNHEPKFHHDLIPGRIPTGHSRDLDYRRESWVPDLPDMSSKGSDKSGSRSRSVSRERGKEEYIRNDLGVIVGKRSSRQASPARSKEGSRSSSKAKSRGASPGLDPNLGAVHFSGKHMEKVVSRLQEVLNGDVGDSLVLSTFPKERAVRTE